MTEIKAKEFAIRVHGEQQYGARPYSFHLESVVQVAKELNLENDIILGCWLHDTIEDCDVSYQDIKREFGRDLAEIVFAVTDELGRNRKERKVKTYPKIKANEKALSVKLCDRIANLNQTISDEKFDLLSMYFKEQQEFKEKLYSPEHNVNTIKLWGILDDLVEKARNIKATNNL
ncbi:HD domain-containing protein [Flavivirga jejuensis]|uniref:HD domain-containing protein n=1 Tax=Flavivirga jejuensis TaxID=870487 RepID=A0ABT8WUB7_9FLAO|nr:HD domain-containing protein [Flavivirga jejuensis]MDO5976777.1 HD domain-containing protein [Flavivirga jejuensis]